MSDKSNSDSIASSYSESHSRIFGFYILFTAIACGALIMVIEVVGSRVVGPFFGVSLFVWTSLITVTLLALALGYAAGGIISDRWPSASALYLIIMAGGILALLVPVLKAPVMKFAVSLGLRGGAFTSTLLLFGPTLFLLGCVSPYLVKIATRELHNLGRVVGGLYALSTLGSTAGTLLTGFFLVGYLGIDRTFLLVGMLLLGLGIVYFVVFKHRWYSLAGFLLPLLLYHPFEFREKVLPDGTSLHKLHHSENYYGSIKVVESRHEQKNARYLLLNNALQGGVELPGGESAFPYTYYLQFLTYLNNPTGKSCLSVGVGIGAVPKWYDAQGKFCDAVDVNAQIFSVARDYFGYVPKGKSIIEDGRYYLASTRKNYDYILLDVFSGELTPSHLLSAEALQLVARRLTASGVLGVNLISRVNGKGSMLPSIVATLKTAFQQVEVYPVLIKENELGNIILLAYQGEPRVMNLADLERFSIHHFYRKRILSNIGTRLEYSLDEDALILTDDYNPIDFFGAAVREAIRDNIQKGVDWDLQIG